MHYILVRVPAPHSGGLVGKMVVEGNDKLIRADALWGDYDVILRGDGWDGRTILRKIRSSCIDYSSGAILLGCSDEVGFKRPRCGPMSNNVYIFVAVSGDVDGLKSFCEDGRHIRVDRVFKVYFAGGFGSFIDLPSVSSKDDGIIVRDDVSYYMIEGTYSNMQGLSAGIMDSLQQCTGVRITRTYQCVSSIYGNTATYISGKESAVIRA